MPKSTKSTMLFGADPEFFSAYQKDGAVYAMPPVIFRRDWGAEFTPNGAHPVFRQIDGVTIHEDGAAFEMSLTPSTDWKDIFDRISNAREKFATDFLSQYSAHGVIPELMALPTVKWSVEDWIGQGADFYMATRFGCDPDKDAFDEKARESVFDASTHGYRYGGGHIHFSGVEEIINAPLIAVKCLALTAGLVATAYSDVPDLERSRVFRYGRPGKFRIQKYGKLFNGMPHTQAGIEYRTLSNRWTSSPELAERVFSMARVGIETFLVEGAFEKVSDEILNETKGAITDFDQEKALQLLSRVADLV